MLTIDGIAYTVPIISINRRVEPLDKYASRTEDGVLKRELIGVYINIEIHFATGLDTTAYAALFDKLSEAEEFHTFTVPDGSSTYTFVGYVAPFGDVMFKYKDPQAFYKDLTVNIISRDPTRV